MRSRAPFPLIVLLLSCTRSRTLPFSSLDSVTRVEVRNTRGADTAYVITGAARVARVVDALHAVDSGWEQPAVTVPSGDAAAILYRDTEVIGVLWLGRDYLVARGGGERILIRSARPEELLRLAVALEFPRKVIPVPSGGTT